MSTLSIMRRAAITAFGFVLTLAFVEAASRSYQPSSIPPPREWSGGLYSCKCYYDDACWPKKPQWDRLNATVGGNLKLHIPPEAVCHNNFTGPLGTLSTFDEAAYNDVKTMYADQEWSVRQDGLLMWKWFTNNTCQPTDDETSPCTLGYYGVYVLDADNKYQIKAGLDFARDYNIRLVVRNTGHDFQGRSTGWGSLIIRTRTLQNVEWIQRYNGPGLYKGRAVTLGAGIQGGQILAQANKQVPPQALMTGECSSKMANLNNQTVGLVGGLIQGGGHGPWTTMKGMVADSVLSFDVITADGIFRTANEKENPDLFWALKGGGPLTYGIVLSATVKTWDDLPASGATLFINSTITTDENIFWEGVSIFTKYSNYLIDNGLYVFYEIWPQTFFVEPFLAINQTGVQLDAILAPFLAELKAADVPFEYTSKDFQSVFDLYTDLFKDESSNIMAVPGGWLFSRKDMENSDKILDAYKVSLSPRPDLKNQGGLIGHLFHAGQNMPIANSATHPKFRDSSNFVISALGAPANASLAVRADLQGVLTNIVDEALRQAGPDGCAYVNEGDPYQPNWQENFWGDNYPKLRTIKEKWDPNGLFWTISTPGSEKWEVIEYETRLCKRLN
ncbi:FAD-linked oxidoreductase ZEB1 [Paramyrothecium foliicola]|nr:FAD-linked oxidoreductase ZEB1 [Paramyrothecium foliicola]